MIMVDLPLHSAIVVESTVAVLFYAVKYLDDL